MDITPFFQLMVDKKASDLFLSVGAVPFIKIEGKMQPAGPHKIKSTDMAKIVPAILSENQRKEFDQTWELNIGYSLAGVGRFRINIFRQRGEIALVARYIQGEIPSLESLHLPPILQSIIMEKQGLVLVVGATNSGKSTTLASMIDYRNALDTSHILTIEDPIEFLYKHKHSIVDQREIGIDTLNYENALKNALREAPDVILIGEIREQTVMRYALTYAQTGHLCLSTLHANNANQALERIINFFPEEARQQFLMDLAFHLRAIISLRLIPGIQQRVPAVEILLNTPFIADLIQKGKIEEIKESMARSQDQGMQTFDQALFTLYKAGKISQEQAITFADSQNNLSLQLRSTENKVYGHSSLTLQLDEEDPRTTE